MTEGVELNAAAARRRAAFGIAILTLRTAVTQVIVLAGTVVLVRVLSPADLGVFAVLQFALTFFQFFGDAGIGGALIQGQASPSERSLASAFTLQMLLAVLLVAVVWVVAPGVELVWSGLPRGSSDLLRAMSLAFLFTAARTIPAILLERSLRFGAIAIAEVLQSATFYATACACAIAGLRDWTWPAAVLAQAVVGFVVFFAAQPWRPRLALDWSLLGPLVRFGMPFQLKNLIGFANGAVTPLYAGAVLGPAPVGLISWGQQVAYLPLKLVEVVARVSFPLFSRMQYDRKALAGVVERSLQLAAFGVFFTTALLLTAGSTITVVVFSEKWLPGLVALQAFSAVLIIGFVSPVIGAAFDAVGRPGIVARLAVWWTALNWVVVPVTTWKWGLNGFVLGYCVHVIVGNVAILFVARRELPEIRLFRPMAAPALGAVLVAAVGWLVLRPWATTPLRLGIGVALAGALHLGTFALVDPQAIRMARRLLAGGGPGP